MQVINTYNESDLHSTLKRIYSLEFDGKEEEKTGPFTCDIVTKDEIIEIQTSNVSALKKKIEYLISVDRKIRIVHPVIQSKIIETYDSSNKLLSKRKSPRAQSEYSALRGLTGICNLLLDKHVTLEFIFVSVTEIRLKTETPVQTKNKSRRHLRDYINKGKRLKSINCKKVFNSSSDYKNLLPDSLSSSFTPPLLHKALLEKKWPDYLNKTNIKKESSNYTLLLWILEKMNIIYKKEKQGRSWIYEIIS